MVCRVAYLVPGTSLSCLCVSASSLPVCFNFNTFTATDVLTSPSSKLLTTPGTFKHVLCIYDYIASFGSLIFAEFLVRLIFETTILDTFSPQKLLFDLFLNRLVLGDIRYYGNTCHKHRQILTIEHPVPP